MSEGASDRRGGDRGRRGRRPAGDGAPVGPPAGLGDQEDGQQPGDRRAGDLSHGQTDTGARSSSPARGRAPGREAVKGAVIAVFVLVVAGGAGVWYWMQWDRVDPGNAGVKINYCDGTQT